MSPHNLSTLGFSSQPTANISTLWSTFSAHVSTCPIRLIDFQRPTRQYPERPRPVSTLYFYQSEYQWWLVDMLTWGKLIECIKNQRLKLHCSCCWSVIIQPVFWSYKTVLFYYWVKTDYALDHRNNVKRIYNTQQFGQLTLMKSNTEHTIRYFNNSLTVLLPASEQSPLIYMRSSSKYSYCVLTACKITIACISSSLWAMEIICTTHRTFHRSPMVTFTRKQDCKQLES